MDPNANLKEQREIIAAIMQIRDKADHDTEEFTEDQELALAHHATRLAELCQALDAWISRSGFLPREWNHAPLAPRLSRAQIVDGTGFSKTARFMQVQP